MSFKKKSCFIIGQNNIQKEDLLAVRLYTQRSIENLIMEGVVYFYVGGSTQYELYVGEILIKLRDKHPYIKVLLMLLNDINTDSDGWEAKHKGRLRFISEVADDVFLTKDYYKNPTIKMRNRYLVDNSCYYIFYYQKNDKEADKALKYADENDLRIIDIHQKITFDASNRKRGR